MFCSNCGKEIDEKAVVCVHCGCAVRNNAVLNKQPKSMLCAVLIWLFLGGAGIHRLYLGHTSTGILMLLCLLFCWLIIPGIILTIWWIIDLFLLVSGGLKPIDGSDLI